MQTVQEDVREDSRLATEAVDTPDSKNDSKMIDDKGLTERNLLKRGASSSLNRKDQLKGMTIPRDNVQFAD